MSVITRFLAGLCGVIHVLFFVMESIFWNNPAVYQVFTVTSAADAETIDVFIKNQGFYNLFLALGIFAGLGLYSRNQIVSRTLIQYICLVMVGASIVLFVTVPAMLTGVFVQGVPPLLALLSLQFGRSAK